MTTNQHALHFDVASAQTAVDVAVRAPSIHNTQPWAWRLTAEGLVLRADHTRQLAVADPDGHSLLVSCGAALHLAERSLRAQGWTIATTLLPGGDDADVLAIIRPTGRRADPLARHEVDAAMRRRSDRRPFLSRHIPPYTLEELQAAAHGHGARVHFPTQPDELINLAVAVSAADRVERDDPAYQAEMRRWINDPEVTAADGIPTGAIPHLDARHPRRADVPPRDFEAGVDGSLLIEQDVDERPLIGVVLTDADRPIDHLRAGRAMMRLMIAAQLHGIATCPLSQAVDLAEFRIRTQQTMGWVGYPQVMLRLGYPSAPVSELPAAPRRGADVVLEVPEPPATS